MGSEDVDQLFQNSAKVHGKAALEATVNIDTTVQEKNMTYPTDGKLAIKIINRLNKLAKANDIQQRRTYGKEVKTCASSCAIFATSAAGPKPRKP